MYRHDVFSSTGVAFMRHYRETTSPSNLAVLTEIGQTLAEIDPFARRATPSGLVVVPDFRKYAHIQTVPDESLECESLDSMVTQGLESWRRLVKDMQNVIRVTLFHQERPVQPAQTASGIVLPDSMREPVAPIYVATADEMTALERMTTSVNVSMAVEAYVPGVYN